MDFEDKIQTNNVAVYGCPFSEQDRQCTLNVTLKCLSATIFILEKQ
jgi:hypothetical protein